MSDFITEWLQFAFMGFMWIWCWSLMRITLQQKRQIMDLKRKGLPEDQRCCICLDETTCPAANSGVLYPCPHFRNTVTDEEWRDLNGEESFGSRDREIPGI